MSLSPSTKIAYLGPQGTFSEEALLSQSDLAGCDLIATTTIPDAIRAAAIGDVQYAFVPIENSIEGPVSTTIDELIFGNELYIQREVVLEIHIDLLASPGVRLGDVRTVISFPHAAAQCRRYLTENLSTASVSATNSTADAARIVAEERSLDTAALASPLTAKMYGLQVLAHAIEDQSGNETRFVLVGQHDVPAPSGNDRTAIVCFQRADRPGSLHDMLGAFAAHGVNLTRIESRPTKIALGDYCFVIEIEGHIEDRVVGDALQVLYDELASIRFLGSYPVTQLEPSPIPTPPKVADESAQEWLEQLRSHVSY